MAIEATLKPAPVNLTGVPETMLWPLYNRASESARAAAIFRDDKASAIAAAIDYPYARSFGPPDMWHVLRPLRFDEQIRRYLELHPAAQVVGLGEGLETQFWRVDNGRVKWLAVDLPESIAVRRRFLPDEPRHRNLAGSALDFSWLDEVDPANGVVVTAQGLLMYFQPDSVRGLIGACAERFSGGIMLFDTINIAYAAATMTKSMKTPDYQLPPMPWGFDADRPEIIKSFHPDIAAVDELDLGGGRGLTRGLGFQLRKRLGWLDRNRSAFWRLRFGAR